MEKFRLEEILPAEPPNNALQGMDILHLPAEDEDSLDKTVSCVEGA